MKKSLLVLQHTPWAGAGKLFLTATQKLRVRVTTIRLWLQEKIPTLGSFDGLVVLDGTLTREHREIYPFLQEEKEVINESLTQDRPYLGIGLGHLLLAKAAGAGVGPNYCTSVGFTEGFLTRKGKIHPVFAKVPARLPLFKWHSQAIQQPVPRNIAILTTSAECQVEAISIKDRPHIVGLQFSSNAPTVADVALYLHNHQAWLSATGNQINQATIRAAAQSCQKTITREHQHIFTNFIKLI